MLIPCVLSHNNFVVKRKFTDSCDSCVDLPVLGRTRQQQCVPGHVVEADEAVVPGNE